MGVKHHVPHDINDKKSIINLETRANRHLELSDSLGFNLRVEDVLFLCMYPGNLSVMIVIDSSRQIAESHEGNNEIWIHDLMFNNDGCTGII